MSKIRKRPRIQQDLSDEEGGEAAQETPKESSENEGKIEEATAGSNSQIR